MTDTKKTKQTSETKNETATTTLKDLRYPAGTKTIGDVCEKLAEAYSGNGDHAGLFILQEALKRATEMRDMQQRLDEAEEMHKRCEAIFQRMDEADRQRAITN